MEVIDCGILNKEGKIKFVLTDDKKLYFGKVKYHKELAPFLSSQTIIGAGIVPIPFLGIDNMEAWGAWQSTGYGVTTPEELREEIYRAIKKYLEANNWYTPGMNQENEDPILFYEGEYYMFSNFSSFAVEYKGKMWMTVEHAYQAAKFEDKEVVELIHKSLSAHDSKKIAHAHEDKINPAWDSIKVSVMEDIIRAKISMHPYVKKKLLETGSREIIEDSHKDSFWGRGPDFKGRSELGKVWMRLRDEMKDK